MSFYSDFAGHYESIFPFEEAVYEFLETRAARGTRVLDVGCGTGDYCGRFASDGYVGVGIDLDPQMIVVARERFPGASFLVLDMENLRELRGPFGCIYSVGNVLSHLPTGRTDTFLDDVAALLEPGGSWIFQTVNWDYLLTKSEYRFPDIEVLEEDLSFEREYPNISADGTPFVTRLKQGNELVFEGSVTLYPLSSHEYVAAHQRHPFKQEGHFADFASSPFDARKMSSSVFHFTMRS